ncbi:hypothetical protein ABZY21_36195, partial [Streptomyces cinerochromogenes]
MLDTLAHTLRRHPDRPAVLGTTRAGDVRAKATLGDLADLADGYTAALHARGVGVVGEGRLQGRLQLGLRAALPR